MGGMARSNPTNIRFLSTEQGFALVLGIAIGAIAIYFAISWHAYDAKGNSEFGIEDNIAHVILEAFTPILSATLYAVRDSFLRGVGQDIAKRSIPGVANLYVVALAGVALAGSSVVYASIGTSPGGMKVFVGVCAAFWGGSVTFVLEKFLKAKHA